MFLFEPRIPAWLFLCFRWFHIIHVRRDNINQWWFRMIHDGFIPSDQSWSSLAQDWPNINFNIGPPEARNDKSPPPKKIVLSSLFRWWANEMRNQAKHHVSFWTRIPQRQIPPIRAGNGFNACRLDPSKDLDGKAICARKQKKRIFATAVTALCNR